MRKLLREAQMAEGLEAPRTPWVTPRRPDAERSPNDNKTRCPRQRDEIGDMELSSPLSAAVPQNSANSEGIGPCKQIAAVAAQNGAKATTEQGAKTTTTMVKHIADSAEHTPSLTPLLAPPAETIGEATEDRAHWCDTDPEIIFLDMVYDAARSRMDATTKVGTEDILDLFASLAETAIIAWEEMGIWQVDDEGLLQKMQQAPSTPPHHGWPKAWKKLEAETDDTSEDSPKSTSGHCDFGTQGCADFSAAGSDPGCR